jgi:hypothetical protein
MPWAASTSRIAPSRAGDLVGEVDVAGGIDQVEHVLAAVLAAPGQPDGLALDRDAALALDVHPVQVLRAHLAALDHAGELEHPVRERRLAVVDMGDDAEIADDRLIGPGRLGQRRGGEPGRGRWLRHGSW